MVVSPESIQDHLPYYLTREQKEGLVKALAAFPRPIDYYINQHLMEMLQGDGWAGLELIRFEDGARNRIKGIVLSNSCDIDPNNKRDFPARIVFAPIIKLSRFADLLMANGLSQDQVESRFHTIREQKVTSMFYLPKGGELGDEYVALLDDIHTIPARSFNMIDERKKLFTLSLVGFYLFLLKLSVHFCRFHEEVAR